MPLSRRLAGAGEQIVLRRRAHAKALIRPAAVLVGVAGLVGVGSALIPRDARPLGQVAVAAVGLLLVVWGSVRPFLRWLSSTYTITTRRLLTRTGLLRTVSQDLPLVRVANVTYERGLADRMLGCGTLVLQTGAEGGTVVLPDLPDVEYVHELLTELIFGAEPEPVPGGARW